MPNPARKQTEDKSGKKLQETMVGKIKLKKANRNRQTRQKKTGNTLRTTRRQTEIDKNAAERDRKQW